MDLPVILVTAAVGVVSALVVHEGGHFFAAHALGGENVRLRFSPLRPRVEAALPQRLAFLVTFLLAGAMANLGFALALLSVDDPRFVLAGLLHLLFAAVNLVPVNDSDGSRLLSLWREGRS